MTHIGTITDLASHSRFQMDQRLRDLAGRFGVILRPAQRKLWLDLLSAEDEKTGTITDYLEGDLDIWETQHRCKDFDADCQGVHDKLNCWLHDPTQGVCPYLAGAMKGLECG